MIWTPARLAALRADATAAMVHLHDAGAPLAAGAWALGGLCLLGLACVAWERALARAGAPALRPLHDLTCALWARANDPSLGVVPGGDGGDRP